MTDLRVRTNERLDIDDIDDNEFIFVLGPILDLDLF